MEGLWCMSEVQPKGNRTSLAHPPGVVTKARQPSHRYHRLAYLYFLRKSLLRCGRRWEHSLCLSPSVLITLTCPAFWFIKWNIWVFPISAHLCWCNRIPSAGWYKKTGSLSLTLTILEAKSHGTDEAISIGVFWGLPAASEIVSWFCVLEQEDGKTIEPAKSYLKLLRWGIKSFFIT